MQEEQSSSSKSASQKQTKIPSSLYFKGQICHIIFSVTSISVHTCFISIKYKLGLCTFSALRKILHFGKRNTNFETRRPSAGLAPVLLLVTVKSREPTCLPLFLNCFEVLEMKPRVSWMQVKHSTTKLWPQTAFLYFIFLLLKLKILKSGCLYLSRTHTFKSSPWCNKRQVFVRLLGRE